MAILSLIAGVPAVLCCWLPGVGGLLGAIATGLGVAAVVFIAGSKGRLAGRGLAVGGIITGLIALVVNITGLVMMMQGTKYYFQIYNGPFGQSVAAIEQGDFPKARSLMDPAAQKTISDADMQRFRDAVKAEIGSLSPPPQGVGELIGLISDFFASAQQKSGSAQKPGGMNSKDQLPLLYRGDKGIMLVFVQHDQRTSQGKMPNTWAPLNFSALFPSGHTVSLVESASPFGPSTSAPGIPAPGADAPKDQPPSAPASTPPTSTEPPPPPKKPG